jgi:hypothetical protein
VRLFEPDILNEVAERRWEHRVAPSERRLMAAILTDAVECFRKNLGAGTRRRRRLFQEAEHWILAEDDDWVFSFRNICDTLGVDARAVRAQAKRWKRERLHRGTPGQLSAAH